VLWYDDWKDLICNPIVEAVIAVTPPYINRAIAEACVIEKKPLLIEKPLAMNSSAASEIVHSFRSSNVPLTVGMLFGLIQLLKHCKKNFIGLAMSFYSQRVIASKEHLKIGKTILTWLVGE
jgi:predicted dehydrogenase